MKKVTLLGYGEVGFEQEVDGLKVTLPTTHPNEIAPVLEVTFDSEAPKTLSLQEVIEMYEQLAGELSAKASNNTGKPNASKVEAFSLQVEDARQYLSASASEQAERASQLHAAYGELKKKGFNPAGTPDEMGQIDVTIDYLLEKDNFSATEMGSRFGKPVNWTVENFSIPQNDTSKGTKNGIDNYPGTNCLMMGKWSGEDGTPATNMTNARIYRTVHLQPGRYFFGAVFNALYNLSTSYSYIYVGTSLYAPASVKSKSLAYLLLSKCATDGNFYGVSFTLDEEQDVNLVFQSNMQSGNANQEFRVSQVELLYCANPENLIQTDITQDMLTETNKFSRITGQSTSTRYGTPANWTVENYNIPTASDGTRSGLDRYPGYDCLTLGVWDDRQNNTAGDLSDARVYSRVNLAAGNYYFGATYEANYQLNEAYIFAASQTLSTHDIPQQTLAYDKISDAGKDNTTYRGVYFELPDAQEVVLGFQADLAGGSSQQEFRASKVKLVRYGVADGIEAVQSSKFTVHNEAVYDLSGRKVSDSQKGIYIVDGKKVVKK